MPPFDDSRHNDPFEPDHERSERLFAALMCDPQFRRALAALIEAALRHRGADVRVGVEGE